MNEDTITVDEFENEDQSSWPPTDETFSKSDLLDGILNWVADIEAVGEEAVEIAVDATFQYVVEWLYERDDIMAAAILGQISGVGL